MLWMFHNNFLSVGIRKVMGGHQVVIIFKNIFEIFFS